MPNVLAFAEARGGELRRVALEATSAARRIADKVGGEVHAVLVGAPGIQAKAAQLGAHGADVVLVAEHDAFSLYNAEAAAALVAERLKGGDYRAAVFSASVMGRDLAPRVAAKLGVPLASDAIDFEVAGDAITVKHPIATGKLLTSLSLSATPALLSIRPGMIAATPNAKAGKVETVAPPADPAASKLKVREFRAGGAGKLDLAEAPVIVAGGRGLKAAENFKLVEELADAFGRAAVGCTRAVSDEGWRPHSDQIGQTGRTVAPQLYVAVGISGAIQHLAGMRGSKTIVAINKDKDAPIFKVADYGIVGDVFEIVPALTAAVKEARKGH